jgi:NAD(P)-dependent dehydrogenase (short-subunit alcohol dehydrogenase family)
MAYFVLTEGLRQRLSASGAARIVNTASEAHRGATLDFDHLQLVTGYGPVKAYNRSKLCNILFTRELARRLRGTGVTANCLHPGFVASRFGDQSGGFDFLRQVVRDITCQGSGDNRLPRFLTRGGGDNGQIFLQASADYPLCGGAG